MPMSRPHAGPRQPPGAISFWFDFGSPYAWLASAQLPAVAARCGRPLFWRPLLLGVVFRRTGMLPLAEQPVRGDYARHDVQRLARRLGLPFATVTPPHGTSLALGRVFHAIALQNAALAADFAAQALLATFGHGEALDDIDAAAAFAARLGPDAAAAAASAMAPPAREALRATTREAIRLGIFGAPFFTVDGEAFWGQDRLPLLEAWIREGPW
jgi:2-hydroxychromene-2-carboxylate isomerase